MKLPHIQDCTKMYVMVWGCDLWRHDTSNAFWSVLYCSSGSMHLNVISLVFIGTLVLLFRLLHSSVNFATRNSPARDCNLLPFSHSLKIRSLPLFYFSSPKYKILCFVALLTDLPNWRTSLVIKVMLQVFHFNNYFVVLESIAQLLLYTQHPSPRLSIDSFVVWNKIKMKMMSTALGWTFIFFYSSWNGETS